MVFPKNPIYTVALGGEVKQRWLKEVDGLNMPCNIFVGHDIRLTAHQDLQT